MWTRRLVESKAWMRSARFFAPWFCIWIFVTVFSTAQTSDAQEINLGTLQGKHHTQAVPLALTGIQPPPIDEFLPTAGVQVKPHLYAIPSLHCEPKCKPFAFLIDAPDIFGRINRDNIKQIGDYPYKIIAKKLLPEPAGPVRHAFQYEFEVPALYDIDHDGKNELFIQYKVIRDHHDKEPESVEQLVILTIPKLSIIFSAKVGSSSEAAESAEACESSLRIIVPKESLALDEICQPKTCWRSPRSKGCNSPRKNTRTYSWSAEQRHYVLDSSPSPASAPREVSPLAHSPVAVAQTLEQPKVEATKPPAAFHQPEGVTHSVAKPGPTSSVTKEATSKLSQFWESHRRLVKTMALLSLSFMAVLLILRLWAGRHGHREVK